MYYVHRCTYCKKIFYTLHDNKRRLPKFLYKGIKEHLKYYDEDRKEYDMDGSVEREVNEMYVEMEASGGYI